MSAGYQALPPVKKKNPCFYFNTMEANVVLHMHELLEAADLDGSKHFMMTYKQELVQVKFSPCPMRGGAP